MIVVVIIALLLADCDAGSLKTECAVKTMLSCKKYFITKNDSCQIPLGASALDVARPNRVFTVVGSDVTVFRVVSGSGVTGPDFYLSSTDFSYPVSGRGADQSKNFKSSLLEEWNYTRPVQMNVTLQDGRYTTVAWLAFSVGPTDSPSSWFSVTKLLACYPWNIGAVTPQTYNYFDITGDTTGGKQRHFFISCSFGPGCTGRGMMGVYGAVDICYFAGLNATFEIPKLFYFIENGACGYTALSFTEVQSMEIRATYDSTVLMFN